MRSRNNRVRPSVVDLERRLDLASINLTPNGSSTISTLPAGNLVPGRFPSADRNRAFASADLVAYSKSYLSFRGESGYDPAFDFNGTGFIGQNDATPILRGLASVTPRKPLKVELSLAPGQAIVGHHPAVSGVATRLPSVTIVGKTTPNSIIFIDSLTNNRFGSTGNFKFQGGAVASDPDGSFSISLPLTPLSKNSLTNVTLLVRSPFNQQVIRAFPIFRVGGR